MQATDFAPVHPNPQIRTMTMKKRRITEKRLETKLATILDRWAEVKTFREAGVLTSNRGLVLTFPQGTEFQITIVESSRRW